MLSLLSCSEEKTTNPPTKECGDGVIFVNDTVGLNRHLFGLEEATIDENCLNLRLSYAGGCGDVSFDLYDFGEYELNDTLHKKIYIEMTTNDPCEAYIMKKYMFDVSELNKSETKSYYLNFVNINDSLLITRD